MLLLALSSLRRRKAAVVGAFLALFSAAAMVCSCGALLETGIHGTVAPQRYAGAPVVVTADQQVHWTKVKHKHGKTKTKTKSKALADRAWLAPSVGVRLNRISDAIVVPDRTFPAEIFIGTGRFIPGEGGRTVGHNWAAAQLTPYHLVAGRPPTKPRQVVVDAGLAHATGLDVGSTTGIQSTGAPGEYVVVGIAQPRNPVTDESAIFFSDVEAKTLAAHGGSVSAYGVFGVRPDRVRSALQGTAAQVATGDDRGTAEFPEATAARARLTSMGGAMGGTAVLVAGLVLVGIFSLSVQQRHRELALLRAVGATPRQVRRLIGREALVLGLAAATPGALLGLPLAAAIRAEFVSAGAVPGTVTLTRGPLPVMGAVLVTVLAAVVAARISARRISRIRPVEALAESAVERGRVGTVRVTAGLLCAAGAGAVSAVLTHLHTEPAATPVTYLAVLLWLFAAGLLGPILARAAVAVLGVPAHLSPVGGYLAVQNSRLRSRRLAAVMTPLALLIGMTSTILFVPATLTSAARSQLGAGLHADRVVASSGPGVADRVVDRLRRTAGVSAAVPVTRSTIWVGRDKRSAEGIGRHGVDQVMDPDVTSGSLAALRPGTIAMSDRAADGRHLGDIVRVTLGDGTKATYRLVATYRRGLAFGDTLLPFTTLRRHQDDPLATAVLVRGAVDPTIVRDTPGLRVETGAAYLRSVDDRGWGNAAVDFVFVVLIVVFSSIATINTLALATMARSRELSLLRLVGATIRQVRGLLRWELAFVLALAAAVGGGAAYVVLCGFSTGMTGSSTPTIEPVVLCLLLLGAVATAAVATFVPAAILLRRNAAAEVATRGG
ncbi:ABC transporter permease [Flexivirga oryzae]|nr:ABC transporter permease [Flexivirga oryzae]